MSLLVRTKAPLLFALLAFLLSVPFLTDLPKSWPSAAYTLQVVTLPLLMILPIKKSLYFVFSALLAYAYAPPLFNSASSAQGALIFLMVYVCNFTALKLGTDVLLGLGSTQFEGLLVFTARASSVAYLCIYLMGLANLYLQIFSFENQSPAQNHLIASIYYSCFIFLGNPPPEEILAKHDVLRIVLVAEAIVGAGVALGLISLYLSKLDRRGAK